MAERIGLKKAEYTKKNEPRWKNKTERDIKRLRQEVNFMEGEPRAELELKKILKFSELNERYRVKRKALKSVTDKQKQ